MPAKKVAPGVYQRGPTSFRAEVWDAGANKSITRTFPTKSAAKNWRIDKMAALRAGTDGAVTAMTLREHAEDWLERAQQGSVRTKGGQPYKPSTLRSYEDVLVKFALPALGRHRLADIRVDQVQSFVDDLDRKGMSRSAIRNTLTPLLVLYADAIRRRRAFTNPVQGLMVAGAESVARDRIATPAEAIELLAALPDRDRSLWATAFYAGLRCGELMALHWDDVDLIDRTIHVRQSYDYVDKRFIKPKSKAGERRLPFPKLLVPYLAAEDRTDGLVFGNDGEIPFGYTGVRKRALKAWAEAEQEPITLHECRHTYASLMLAAGVDMTKVSKWLGHSSITMTVDRYGHLVPGTEDEAMAQFEAFLVAGASSRQ